MKKLPFLAIIGALFALVGCQGSPHIALPPPPAPRAFVTNSHTPLNFTTFCCCGSFTVCCISSNCSGGLGGHRHALGTQRGVAGAGQHRSLRTINVTGARLPMTVFTNLLNVYGTPLNPNGAPSFALSDPAAGLGRPGGVAVDSAGNVFVIDFSFDEIFEFAAPVTASSKPAFHFAVPGGTNPFAIAFDPRGRLWATDRGANHILRFDPPLSACTTAQLEWRIGCSPQPAGITFDRSGAMYVAMECSNRIEVWRPNQQCFGVSICGSACAVCAPTPDASFASGLCSPTSVSIDGAQRLFVGNKFDDRIRVFSPPFGNSNSVPPNFTFATHSNLLGSAMSAFDASGNLYVPFVSDFGPNTGGLAVFIPPYSASSAPIFILRTALNSPYGIAFGR